MELGPTLVEKDCLRGNLAAGLRQPRVGCELNEELLDPHHNFPSYEQELLSVSRKCASLIGVLGDLVDIQRARCRVSVQGKEFRHEIVLLSLGHADCMLGALVVAFKRGFYEQPRHRDPLLAGKYLKGITLA